ncbi:predicted protein [Lichtheimia corymbifera JMRC:FSU:9682]|uniref:Uncharacterized protein n=1 Tax=Lichtheimia corymbifera JMRC:FSU:9682 TaxID=1263082 RepID=A0A068RMG3_9FUNG|nr:predicted protein [Lichtheimia corymbifera JMRC:FSU:9682]
MDQLTVCMNMPDSTTNLNFQLFHLQPPLSPILNCCPNQLQRQPTNDCPASTYHVKPTIVLIRLPLTEWQVYGVCTHYNTGVP